MFAFAGAHRCGKTTLANLTGKTMKAKVIETNLGHVFEDLKISPKADIDFKTRMSIQNAMLDSLEKSYESVVGEVFIADRSPFDVLGYTMAEIQRSTLDEAGQEIVAKHIARVIQITSDHLSGIFVLEPLLGQPETEGKAQSCPVYTLHVDSCIRGGIRLYAGQVDQPFYCSPITYRDLNKRLEAVILLMNKVFKDEYGYGETKH